MKDEQKKPVSFRIDMSLCEELCAYARIQGRRPSQQVRYQIRQALQIYAQESVLPPPQACPEPDN